MGLNPKEKAEAIVQAVEDRRGLNIVIMDMQPVTTICDYFVVCHGRSPQHLAAIAEEVQAQMEKLGVRPGHVEGSREGRWILIDYLPVVVHIYSEEPRQTYDLQRLWSDAIVVTEHSDE